MRIKRISRYFEARRAIRRLKAADTRTPTRTESFTATFGFTMSFGAGLAVGLLLASFVVSYHAAAESQPQAHTGLTVVSPGVTDGKR